MSAYTLTKTRFRDGNWQGLLVGEARGTSAPEVVVTLEEVPLRGVTLTETADPGCWALDVPVPVEAVGDGVRTFVIRDAESGARLDSFALIAGEALDDDLRAEISLLRAELDLLKRAFRQHCLDSGKTRSG
ncbi:MAG: hypothetical protein ACU0A5_01515 [Salipiger marinus]|uniref:hypothetical protein n=1 Tax=Salipiger marinus TaxID=555512 RepID=UPI004059E2B5